MKTSLILCFIIFFNQIGAQDLKRIDKSNYIFGETYYVLKNKKNIKQGQYLKYFETMKDYDKAVETAPAYWGADGLNHQTYKYTSKGLEFDLVQRPDSGYAVNMITILTPCDFKTLKGIGINSDIESVKKEYLNYIDPKFSVDKSVVAGSIYGGIIFAIKNQRVKSIFIGQSAE